MQKTLVSASNYFSKWKIKINDEKTQAILFPYNKSPKRIPTRKLFIQGTEIPFSKSIKYLGITFDEKLTFKEHLTNVCVKATRCSKALYPLLNRRSKLDTRNKLLLYKLCISPILTYGCVVWKDCAKTHKKKAQIIQNKNLKIIHNLPIRFPTLDLHRLSHQRNFEQLINDMSLSFYERCRVSTFSHLRSLANID